MQSDDEERVLEVWLGRSKFNIGNGISKYLNDP